MVLALVNATFKEIVNSVPKRIALTLLLSTMFGSTCMYLNQDYYDGRLPNEYLVPAVCVIAAGVIGNDSTGGIMPLVFSRPISRTRYLFSKWISIIAFSTLFVLLMDGLSISITSLRPELMLDPLTAGIGLFNHMFTCVGLSTVLLFFSTILPSFGDVALYGAIYGAAGSIATVSGWLRIPELGAVCKDLLKFFNPTLDLAQILCMQFPSVAETFTYLGQIFLFLAAATIVINQKEISYGAE